MKKGFLLQSKTKKEVNEEEDGKASKASSTTDTKEDPTPKLEMQKDGKILLDEASDFNIGILQHGPAAEDGLLRIGRDETKPFRVQIVDGKVICTYESDSEAD